MSTYIITTKNPKIKGYAKFERTDNSELRKKASTYKADTITSVAVLEGFEIPWYNPITGNMIEETGVVLNVPPKSQNETSLVFDSRVALKKMIKDKFGIDLVPTYTEGPIPSLQEDLINDNIKHLNSEVSTEEEEDITPVLATETPISSTFNSDGLKVTLLKKSGPGDIIGNTSRIVSNGYIDFDGIVFNAAGDYVISVVHDSDRVELIDVNIKVLPEDEVIAQEDSRGSNEQETPLNGTRPIIAQIDKPTVKLPPIRFEANHDNQDSEVAVGLGFVPFVWYNGYQISPPDIKSLRLYYDGISPTVIINFYDSVGFMNKEGFPLDDTKFEIFLNSGSDILKSIHMKFKVIKFNDNKTRSYTITGSIDLKDFYNIQFKGYSGTSFEVIRKISNDLNLGLNSNITNTVDNMRWVNNGEMFKDFISNIINHSYISDTSYVLGYIDYYYCFNYVDIEKEWQRDISNDVGLASTGVNFLNDKSQKDKIERIILSNDQALNASPFYFSTYKITNNSTKQAVSKGHFTTSKSYDSNKKQFLVFDVDSQNGDESKNVILKGAPGDSKSMEDNYRTKYSGKMDSENVHTNYYYSETQNKVNLDNMVKISVDLTLPNANFNLYKYMKVEIAFINQQNTPTITDISQERLSGEWMIIDISYLWIRGKLTQTLKCVRKELSKTKEEIDTQSTSTKSETNTENNVNPDPVDTKPVVPQDNKFMPNAVYSVGNSYTVQSKDGKKYKLTVTAISENGKDVTATIKNI